MKRTTAPRQHLHTTVFIIAAVFALSSCSQRSSYNPFGSPDHSSISGTVDARPLNGK